VIRTEIAVRSEGNINCAIHQQKAPSRLQVYRVRVKNELAVSAAVTGSSDSYAMWIGADDFSLPVSKSSA